MHTQNNLSDLEAIELITIRSDGSIRIQQDFTHCPSMTDQSQKDTNDINVLMKKYKPDELAMFLASKGQNKQEIIGHDFSQEPNLQEANNVVYRIKQEFNELDPMLQARFQYKPAEFLKFAENPQNIPQLQAWGIYKKATPIPAPAPAPAPAPVPELPKA